MKTHDMPSSLINQAITNLSDNPRAIKLREDLWRCMKHASLIELEDRLLLPGEEGCELSRKEKARIAAIIIVGFCALASLLVLILQLISQK